MMREYYYKPIKLDGFWRVLVAPKGYWDEKKKIPKQCDEHLKKEMFTKGFWEYEEFIFTLRVKTSDTSIVEMFNKFGMTLNEKISKNE